jgi:AcrR family transcriptional regulator
VAARDGLISSTIELVRRNGVAGTGLTQLLEHSGISRRSIYLNFPHGKSELVAEATRVAGAAMGALIERFAATPKTSDAIAAFTESWKQILVTSGFTSGCPIVAAALGRSESQEAAAAAGEAFGGWEQTLATRLREEQIAPDTAQSLATTVIAAIEGAVIMSLATQSTEPLDRTSRHMSELVELHAQR